MTSRTGLLGVAALVAGLLAGAPAPAAAQSDGRVFLTEGQALAEIFGEGARMEADRGRLDAATVRRISDTSGSRAVSAGPDTRRVYRGDRLVGYAMVLEERGKYRPITFMVGVDPEFAVKGVEVMVYREDRGDEVRHGRFLRQYEDKTLADPIRTHRDIVNVTGATISVTSMNVGVRRALATLEAVYGTALAKAGR